MRITIDFDDEVFINGTFHASFSTIDCNEITDEIKETPIGQKIKNICVEGRLDNRKQIQDLIDFLVNAKESFE